jgi:hypothetical protein
MSMKRALSAAAALLLLVSAVPAMAGDHQKCDQPAEACLNAYAQKLEGRGWVGIEMDTTEDGHRDSKPVMSWPASMALPTKTRTRRP